MRKALITALGIMFLLASVAKLAERTLTAAIFSMWLLVVVLLYRRFRRSTAEVPYAYAAAAAIALTLDGT